jgi:hypothetical protein
MDSNKIHLLASQPAHLSCISLLQNHSLCAVNIVKQPSLTDTAQILVEDLPVVIIPHKINRN